MLIHIIDKAICIAAPLLYYARLAKIYANRTPLCKLRLVVYYRPAGTVKTV